MNRKVIFFDVDGTVYSHGIGVPEEVRDALIQLKEKGHIVSLNTGRPRYFIPDEVEALDVDGIVAGSGSHVEYQGKTIYEKYVPETLVRTLVPLLYEAQAAFTVETPEYIYLSGKMASRQGKVFDMASRNSQIKRFDSPKYQLKDTVKDFDPSVPVNKVSFLVKGPEEMAFIKNSLGNDFYILTEPKENFGYIYGEAVSAGCSKAEGMRILCRYLGVDIKDAIAFGDGMNDVDMVKAAGTGVLLGDADESIRQYADVVCGKFNDGGICSGLKMLGLL